MLEYSLDGVNVLWEDETLRGRTLAQAKQSFLPGGYQLDVYPPMRADKEAYAQFWVGPARAEITGEHEVTVTSDPDSRLGFHLTKRFRMDPATGGVTIAQRITNHGGETLRLGLWDRTWTRAGDTTFFPMKKHSLYPDGWDFLPHFKRNPDPLKCARASEQFIVSDGLLIVDYKGVCCQMAADCEDGWICWTKDRLAFVIRFPFDPAASYPFEGGGNVSIFTADEKEMRMVELEPASPLFTLAPGQTGSHTETWELFHMPRPLTTTDDVARFAVNRHSADRTCNVGRDRQTFPSGAEARCKANTQ